MSRADSMIWFMLGFAQLIMANQIGTEGIMIILDLLLTATGGSSLLIGLYVLLFFAKHSKDFSAAYPRFEKSEVSRNIDGNLQVTDGDSNIKKGLGIVIPAVLTMISAIVWLSTL